MRHVINYTIGNSDNHGCTTVLIKHDGRNTLFLAYDLATMVLDREAIARTTICPQSYQHLVYEPNYDKILRDFAVDPDTTGARFKDGTPPVVADGKLKYCLGLIDHYATSPKDHE